LSTSRIRRLFLVQIHDLGHPTSTAVAAWASIAEPFTFASLFQDSNHSKKNKTLKGASKSFLQHPGPSASETYLLLFHNAGNINKIMVTASASTENT